MTAEKKLKELTDITIKLKTSIYSLVNEYRRLIYLAVLGNKDFTKMCRVTDGQVDEAGKIFVTKDMLSNFTERFKNKCITEALYWSHYVNALDLFVKYMLNFDDPLILLKTKNKQLFHLYECWFGDVYKENKERGLLRLLSDIDEKRKNINVELFKELNNASGDEETEETLLQGLPL
jgi:hypothetical protein